MLNSYVFAKVQESFRPLEERYGLRASVRENELRYCSKTVCFSVWFERYCELDVGFCTPNGENICVCAHYQPWLTSVGASLSDLQNRQKQFAEKQITP